MKHTAKLLILAAGVIGTAGLATAGWAYWSAGGSGSASAAVGTLNPPTIGTTSQQGLGTLRVNWTASTGDVTPTGYYVQRYAGTTLDGYACDSSPAALEPASSCDDQGLTAAGPYHYTVTAVFRSWTARSAASNEVSVILDNTPPMVLSINRTAVQRTNATNVSWTVTFSEAVTGVDTGDFAMAQQDGVSGAAVTDVSGSGTTWSATASTGTGDGTLGLNLVDNNTVIDAAGNRLGGPAANDGNFTGQTYSIDKTAPSVISITRAGANPTNAATVSWTVTFSESVNGADTGDFTLVGSSAPVSSIAGANGLSFTVTANTGTGDGSLGLNLVDDDTIIDEAGNSLRASGGSNDGSFTGQVYTIDKTAPTVTINEAAGQADPTNTSPLNFTVVFSESVSTFTSADLTLGGGAGGTQSVTVTGSGTTYNVAISGMTDGTVIPTIPAGAAPDAAGNSNTASTSTDNSVVFDATAPAVTIDQKAGQSDPTNTFPILYTITFSEPVTGFDATDLTRTGTSAGGTVTVTGSGASYEVAVGSSPTDGTITFTIAAGKTKDAAGNHSLASTSSDNTVTYDTTAPAPPSVPDLASASDSGSSNADNITNDTTPTFTGTAEAGATITILDGATPIGSGVATGGAYSIRTSLLADGGHTITAKATDTAGNSGPASSGTSITVDTAAPTVTIDQATGQNDPTKTGSATFTAVFSEPVTGFTTSSDLTVGGSSSGTKSASISGTGTTYSVTVTGATGNGTITASVRPAAAQDTAGNDNVASTSSDNSVTLDTTRPTASGIVISNGSGESGRPDQGDTVTLTFSEQISTASILTGWTGRATDIVVRGNGASGNDSLTFFNSTNNTQLPLGSIDLDSTTYFTANITFGLSGTKSSMSAETAADGETVLTITLGTVSDSTKTGHDGNDRSNATWTPSATVADIAGNSVNPATTQRTGNVKLF